MSMKIRRLYEYDADEVSRDTGLFCDDGSKTVQSEKDEADINVILERFGITKELRTTVRAPTYEDFGDTIFDFRTAMEAIELAEDAFMSMPAKVRSRFDNDPQKFVEFCSDEKNLPEMKELGLMREGYELPKAPEAPK